MSASLDRLAEALESAQRELPGSERNARELAARFGAPVDQVDDGLRGLRALEYALGEDADPAGSAPTPPRFPDDLQLRGELGRGAMGVVYRAWQPSLHRELAVKVLMPGEPTFGSAQQRFRREAQRLARLRHPHIVQVHEVGEADGHVYFTMDLVEGGTLRDLIRKRRMPVAQSVHLIRQVAEAIAYAHEQGVVHRDLKPANILIAEREPGRLDAFVVDFGLARETGAGDGYTLTGQILGTPGYMSPEQALGQTDRIGEHSDIYALGILLYECLTRRTPFGERPLVQTLRAIAEEHPPAPQEVDRRVPLGLGRICMKAMAKQPEERFPTARALVEELRRFEAGEPLRTGRPNALGRAAGFVRRHRAKSLWLVPVLLLIAWSQSNAHTTRAALTRQGDALFAAGNYAGAAACYDEASEYGREPYPDLATSVRHAASLMHCAGALDSEPDRFTEALVYAQRAARAVEDHVGAAATTGVLDRTIPDEPTLADRALVEWSRARAWTEDLRITAEQTGAAWWWPERESALAASQPLLLGHDAMTPLLHAHPELAQELALNQLERGHLGSTWFFLFEKRVRRPELLIPTTDQDFERRLADFAASMQEAVALAASRLLQRTSHVPDWGLEKRRNMDGDHPPLQALAERFARIDTLPPLQRRLEILDLLRREATAHQRRSRPLDEHFAAFYRQATGVSLGPDTTAPRGDDPRAWVLDALDWQTDPDALTADAVLARWRAHRQHRSTDRRDLAGHFASLLELLVPRGIERPVGADFARWQAALTRR